MQSEPNESSEPVPLDYADPAVQMAEIGKSGVEMAGEAIGAVLEGLG